MPADTGGCNDRLAVAETPASVAVTTAVELAVIVPAAAAKVAAVAPAATVTEPGTATDALLEDRATATPPEAAAPLRATVQVLDAPDARLVGLHASDVSFAAGAGAGA